MGEPGDDTDEGTLPRWAKVALVVIGAVAVSALWFGALARYALSELQRD